MRLALLLALAGASLSPAAVVVRAALIFPALATDGPVCDAAELSCPPRPSPGSSWDPFACVPCANPLPTLSVLPSYARR